MNQKIKELWIAALRSGEYKQSQHALRTSTGYCCLGVLCDLAAKAGIGSWTNDDRFRARDGQLIKDELPTEVIHWAGLGSRNPDVSKGSLARQNDIGKSFIEIASMIEQEL